MENKQIIIDNIDVSGCEYYFDEKCRCMDASIMQDFYSCPQCNSNPNCHYKNWQRKEQENKALREEKAYTDMACELLQKQLKRKEQKIKQILEIHKENKCAICPKFDECFEQPSCDNVILRIIEGKDNG